VQNDRKLYQTRDDAVFHVEPMSFRQPCEGGITWVQCRHEKLRRQVDHLRKQPFQIPRIELGRRIIHK